MQGKENEAKQTTMATIIAARRKSRGCSNPEKSQGMKNLMSVKGNTAIEDNITQQDILNHFEEKMRSLHEKIRVEQEQETALIE